MNDKEITCEITQAIDKMKEFAKTHPEKAKDRFNEGYVKGLTFALRLVKGENDE